MRGFHASVAALAASLVCAAAPARADDLADVWRGKSVAMHIPAGPGGGYDTYGRLVARHLGKHIPGNPNIVAQNMTGATGLVMANYLYNVAPRDGTAMMMIMQPSAMNQALGLGRMMQRLHCAGPFPGGRRRLRAERQRVH